MSTPNSKSSSTQTNINNNPNSTTPIHTNSTPNQQQVQYTNKQQSSNQSGAPSSSNNTDTHHQQQPQHPHHDNVNTHINTSSPSRGPYQQQHNGMNKNYSQHNRGNNPGSNFHPRHQNHHHHQGPPQYYPAHPQQYPPPPIYSQVGPPHPSSVGPHPHIYPYNHQYSPVPQPGPVPVPSQGPVAVTPVINNQYHPQGPSSPVSGPHSHPQSPVTPPGVAGNTNQPNSASSPNQQRHQPIPIQLPPNQNPQGIPTNQPNRKIQPKSSVSPNNIPPRTHSAPIPSNPGEDHPSTKFIPDKTSQPLVNNTGYTGPQQQGQQVNSYSVGGFKGQGQPGHVESGPQSIVPGVPPQGVPVPHHQPYPPHHGYQVYYTPYPFEQMYPGGGYYYGQGMQGVHPSHTMNSSSTYIKETKTSSKLAIIDPKTNEQVNQSPPKSTPQVPPVSPPQFSLGNEAMRKHKEKEQKEKEQKEKEAKEKEQKEKEAKEELKKVESQAEENKLTTPTEESKPVEKKEEEVKVEPTPSTPPTIKEDEVASKLNTSEVSQISKEETSEPSTVEIKSDQTKEVTEGLNKLEIKETTTEEGEIKDEDKATPTAIEAVTPSNSSSTSTPTTPPSKEEPSTAAATSNGITSVLNPPPGLRTTSEKITYSRDFMISLQPKSVEEPRLIKDLKSQMETANAGSNQLNRSGNKIGNQNLNRSGNYQQGQMKMYPNQMPMKNFPQGQNKYQQNFGKNYQQQIQQGLQQQQQGQLPPLQAHGYGITAFQQPPVQPSILTQPANENRWMPTETSKLDDNQKTLRKAKFILNKISPIKFESLTSSLFELGIIENDEVHKGTIQMIFDKAINESKFCNMYSELCKKIFEFERSKKNEKREQYFKDHPEEKTTYAELPKNAQDSFDDTHGLRPVFRKLLLITCQQEYEKVQKEIEKPEATLPDNSTPEEKADFEERLFIKRKLEFGLIKFIGELFNKDMLSEKILHGILVALLGELARPNEVKLECFCKLLTITGLTLRKKNEKVADYLDKYQQRMKELTHQQALSQRLKFLIQNVIDLQKNDWVPKTDESAKPTPNESQRDEDNRKSSTGVKTGVKNNFITNSFKFNKQPNITTPTIKTTPVVPPSMIMKKNPPGLPPSKPAWGAGSSPLTSVALGSSPTTTSTSSSSNPNAAQWEKVKRTMEESISEYLEIRDKSEFIACVEDYLAKQEHLYPFLISTLIVQSINESDELSKLLLDLVTEDSLFTVEQFKEGFNIFASHLTDLFEDRPGSYKIIAKILHQYYTSKILPLSVMTSALSKQVETTANFCSQILFEFVLQFTSPKDAASQFNEQKVHISDYFFSTKKDKNSIIDQSTKYNSSLSSFLDQLKEF